MSQSDTKFNFQKQTKSENHIHSSKKFSNMSAQGDEEPLFFKAMRIAVSKTIVWDKEDLKSLLAAVPRNSIGQQTATNRYVRNHRSCREGYFTVVPQCFRDNDVRLVDWDYGTVELRSNAERLRDWHYAIRDWHYGFYRPISEMGVREMYRHYRPVFLAKLDDWVHPRWVSRELRRAIMNDNHGHIISSDSDTS